MKTYTIITSNWVTDVMQAVEHALPGDKILVDNETQKDMAVRFLKRIKKDKVLVEVKAVSN